MAKISDREPVSSAFLNDSTISGKKPRRNSPSRFLQDSDPRLNARSTNPDRMSDQKHEHATIIPPTLSLRRHIGHFVEKVVHVTMDKGPYVIGAAGVAMNIAGAVEPDPAKKAALELVGSAVDIIAVLTAKEGQKYLDSNQS